MSTHLLVIAKLTRSPLNAARILGRVLLLLITLYGNLAAATAETEVLQQAQTAAQQGQFSQAITAWQQALDAPSLDNPQRLNLNLQLAQAYQALGLSTQAQQSLNAALPLAGEDKLSLAKIYSSLSDIALATRQYAQARFYIDKSLLLLPADAPPVVRASVLNHLGNVFTVEAYYVQALNHYEEALTVLKKSPQTALSVRILSNKAHAYFKNEQLNEALSSINTAWALLSSVQEENQQYQKAFSALSLSDLLQRIQRTSPFLNSPFARKSLDQVQTLTHDILQQALKIAKQLQNQRLLSYANGYLGQLAEIQQYYDEALKLTRSAIFFAQQEQALEILYRWQWQLGRIFKAQQHIDEAIAAYRQAVGSLQPIRQELTIGYRNTSQSFRDTVGPVYFELADLLLQRAKQASDKTASLLEARDTIERLKTAELQDYFKDECLASPSKIDAAPLEKTAVLYPILLPDRIELLLHLPNGLQQVSVEISGQRLREEVNEFRFELETRDTNAFISYAQRLYGWLIAPLDKMLIEQKIDTLVIVPDGVLRTIPLAALHDGKNFLIQKYALVSTPGLTLTDFKPLNGQASKILIGGLAEGVQGYVELASVREEVKLVGHWFGQSATILMDQQFTSDKFSAALENTRYNLVHIASHGQFDGDPQKTFLLTYDDKLVMSRLEKLFRLRREPVDLLTLSACQTAVGDDQAALGLAGVALKAGVRSALATLWFIDDQATAELIGEFYRQLQQEHVSKAKALQNAQKRLLAQPRYQHPAFWSPFLLIGNWL
ncbi:MAG: CHAT domain-containing protein [Thiotrichaceae bacterium]|nr:CHAT domain-containing protein [Thiotrichaceae bacterium]